MSLNERRNRLLSTMKSFNKNQKDEILSFGNEAQEKEVIATGVKAFDDFIGGGTKRGTFTVIYGGQSVGKTTLVLQAIANAQKDDKICCYIDLEHTFDKERAVSLGINLNELVLAEKCQNAEQALEIIRKLCKEKVIDLIVVDSVQAMSPKNEQENKGKERELASKEIAELARTLSKFFRVVSPDVFNAQASVIMIGQIRIAGIGSFFTHADMSGGEAIKHWAYTRCFIRRGQKSDAPVEKFKEYIIDPEGKIRFSTQKKMIGFDAVIKIEKTKSSNSATEGSDIHLPFIFDKGFVNEIKEAEEISIRIDSEASEEEKKKIEEYLKKKENESLIVEDKSTKIGVSEECITRGKEQELIKEKKSRIVRAGSGTLSNGKTMEDVKKAVDNVRKKRGRGRPKKLKEEQ